MEKQQYQKDRKQPSKFVPRDSSKPVKKQKFIKKQTHNKDRGQPRQFNKKFAQPNKAQTPQNNTQVKKQKKIKGNEQLPTIQTMLQIPKESREDRTTELFKKIKPFLDSYIQKKIGSRVIQLMYKWGNQEVKKQIHKSILQHWKDLIRSKYALHAISKVSSDYEFPRLAEDAIILQNNKEGSMLLENFLTKHHGSPKCQQIFNKFESIEKQAAVKGLASQEPLHNLAMKSIEKLYYGNKVSKLIIRLAFLTLIESEREKVIQFFADKTFELITDEQGVKLFILLFNYFNTKQKKAIIKSFDGRVEQALRYCKISYVALIKIITETDDTVILANHLVPELLQGLAPQEDKMENQGQQVQNNNNTSQHNTQKLFSILISLLSPRNNNFNCLGKIEKNVVFTTCKKPEEKRKQQIRAIIYPTLVEYVTNEQNLHRICSDPNQSKIILGLIKSMEADVSDSLKQFATKIIKYFIKDLESKKVEGSSKKLSISQSLTSNNFGSKVIKNILLLQQPFIDKYCDKFSEIFKSNLHDVLNSNASFVMTVLIQKGRNQLLQEIKRSRIDLSKVKASDFYSSRLKPNKSK